MNMIFRLSLVLGLFLFLHVDGTAQRVSIKGVVTDSLTGTPMEGVMVHVQDVEGSEMTDAKGEYKFSRLKPGFRKMTFFLLGFRKVERFIDPKNGTHTVNVKLAPLLVENQMVVVKAEGEEAQPKLRRMRSVEGVGIFSSRKTEVLNLAKVEGLNLAANRARQAFGKISGLNIWESDCAGIQIGVGSRGLSPNRTENFNTRQNGYDIAADALGYPESYYSPPMLAIEKVEVIRGAASLQFGPQFGGLINFVMKDGPKDKKFELDASYSLASRGFQNAFMGIGGTAKGIRYYAFGQYRKGNCWRCNSEFDNYTVYGSISKLWEKSKLRLEYTRMHYLAQQSGGLTDAQFAADPSQSNRERNWFKVDWNLFSLSYQIQRENTKIDIRNFGVLAERNALGFLGPPSEADPIGSSSASARTLNRNLINGVFQNIGHETRVLHTYRIKGLPSSFVAGVRGYRGFTRNKQGAANALSGPDFYFEDGLDANSSSSSHPSWNVAVFAENVFNLSEKWSVTPGFRVEYINTQTSGEARNIYRNLAGDIILDTTRTGSSSRSRVFPLFGLGTSFKPNDKVELYANFSQNYKPINFTDLWVSNPSFRIDPDMKDETGFNADLGFRGRLFKHLQIDLTAFMLYYQDRIGSVQQTDSETFAVYRLRTNVAAARTFGLESFMQLDVAKAISSEAPISVVVFNNFTWLNARYVSSAEPAFAGKEVEFTPSILLRSGVTFAWKGITLNYQFNFTNSQFTDATNSEQTANAVNGRIPAYYVMDLTLGYRIKQFTITTGIENLTDNRYFTRRATGYPGPGILPSESRNFFLSLSVKI